MQHIHNAVVARYAKGRAQGRLKALVEDYVCVYVHLRVPDDAHGSEGSAPDHEPQHQRAPLTAAEAYSLLKVPPPGTKRVRCTDAEEECIAPDFWCRLRTPAAHGGAASPRTLSGYVEHVTEGHGLTPAFLARQHDEYLGWGVFATAGFRAMAQREMAEDTPTEPGAD